MLLFAWIPKPVFAGTVLLSLRPSFFSNILKFNLPDTLWFLSAILFLRFIWFYRTKIQKAYIHSFYAIAAIFEISQLSKKVLGTFDWLDLLFMGIGAFVEGLLYNIFTKRRFV
jgi:phosphoglycerol transferase MdoB-like AlkP superfamily enzyme